MPDTHPYLTDLRGAEMSKLNLDTSVELDLEMVEGIDYAIDFQIEKDDGSAYNFTGCSAIAEFKTKEDGPALITFSSVSPETDITFNQNLMTWNISNVKTAAKGGSEYFYALVLTDINGKKHLLQKGMAVINNR